MQYVFMNIKSLEIIKFNRQFSQYTYKVINFSINLTIIATLIHIKYIYIIIYNMYNIPIYMEVYTNEHYIIILYIIIIIIIDYNNYYKQYIYQPFDQFDIMI